MRAYFGNIAYGDHFSNLNQKHAVFFSIYRLKNVIEFPILTNFHKFTQI